MKALLITVDAWRASHAPFLETSAADDVAFSSGEPTPTLSGFADEAAVFPQAVSHGPATPYAFPGILTSTLPLDHGGYETLGSDRTHVAEALSAAGWECAGFHANPWLGEQYGYARGYDTYRDTGEFGLPLLDRGRTVLIDRFGLDHPVYRAAQRCYRRVQTPLRRLTGEGQSTAAVAARALEGSEEASFAWVHLLAPHAPYDPPERHREAIGVPDLDVPAETLVTRAQHDPEGLDADERAAVRALYAASVRHADEQVGKLLAATDEETLVVVTADHGEALFEHGQLGHEPALYDELVHVPLLVRPPGGTDRGAVDAGVRHVDIAPTILDYAGVDRPEGWRGRSLRPLVDGRAEPDDRPAVLEVASTPRTPGQIDPDALQIGIRTPHRKLVDDGDGLVGFDLVADPAETDPIPTPRGGDWRPLRERLEERRNALSFDGREVGERDAAVEKRLEDLGYLG